MSELKMSCGQVHGLMQPYIDGALSAREEAEVARHVEDCDSCRSEVETTFRVEERLRLAFESDRLERCHALWQRIEISLADASLAGMRQDRGRRGRQRGIFGGIAILVLALALGLWLFLRTDRHGAIAEIALTPVRELQTYRDSGRALDIAVAEPEAVRQWFAGRLSFEPPRPAVVPGLALRGGRLCYFLKRRALSYMYEAGAHAVSLYVMEAKGLLTDGARRSFSGSVLQGIQDYGYVFWREGGLVYFLVGDMTSGELSDLALRMGAPLAAAD